jgi:hypothetical protein
VRATSGCVAPRTLAGITNAGSSTGGIGAVTSAFCRGGGKDRESVSSSSESIVAMRATMRRACGRACGASAAARAPTLS